jgi:hypothetical protein
VQRCQQSANWSVVSVTTKPPFENSPTMDALAAPQDGPTAVLRRIKILHIEDEPGVARAWHMV